MARPGQQHRECWVWLGVTGGGGAVQRAMVKELTESIHCRETYVFSGIINLGYPRAGSREDEMTVPCGSSALPRRFLSALSSRRAPPALSLWFQPPLAALVLISLASAENALD